MNNQVDGGIRFWLKADPRPPWLEHLSFRLGNQLFFVRIADVDGQIETTGNDRGIHTVAQECGGHPCLMPMKKTFFGGKWTPVNTGWGLVDANTGTSINPIELVTDEKIEVSDWELNDIAVQVVRTNLESDGYQLMSWVSNPGIDPAIWFIGKSKKPEWTVVRAIRYPSRTAKRPANKSKLIERFSSRGEIGHFASVRVANADNSSDSLAESNGNYLPIYRGHPMFIGFDGLESI